MNYLIWGFRRKVPRLAILFLAKTAEPQSLFVSNKTSSYVQYRMFGTNGLLLASPPTRNQLFNFEPQRREGTKVFGEFGGKSTWRFDYAVE